MFFSLGSLIFVFVFGTFIGFMIFHYYFPEDLNKKLKDAIDREDYEAAAKINKKIKNKT